MKKYCLFVFLSLLLASPLASQSADLGLELDVDNNLVEIGQTVTFKVRVINNGPDTTLGVKVLYQLPSGYNLVSNNATQGTYDAINGIWDIGGMGYGINVILKVTATVKNSGDYTNLAEVFESDLLDYDSVPNNGVDTDGDGIVMNDPDDEDDGDGQVMIVNSSASEGASTSDIGECIATIDAESSMSPNPVDKIDEVFKFDYKIKAVVNFQMADTDEFSPEYSHGNPNQLIMEYYVNSADGSMFLPGGPFGFFKTNFSYSTYFGKIDGAIWLPNGQMVVYGYDAKDRQNRAVTRESIQTADSRWSTDYLNMMQFFSSSEELAEHPGPMPERVQWSGTTVGYKGKLIEGLTGIENTWNIYFDTAPTPIKTSCIMMGFMVGVLKDARELKCNRLVVYTKVNIGGEDTGDVIEAELKSIKPMGITFDGTSYKPQTIGGDFGTPAMAKMDDFEDKMRSIEIRRQTIEREKKRCMNERCIDQKIALLEDLRKEKSQVICEQMVAMGMEDSFTACMRKEEEGY
ncbi:MAG: DUF11 domain-containing protein [Maribacter sp.]|nr:DUF11 domain-containing protein [Maribacter sp.]